ncbi:MAG TPA: hypothetical protein VM639_12685 [Dongiaceae bacterium]|nr:hypothetical protein [Dongiaceae bacterium]
MRIKQIVALTTLSLALIGCTASPPAVKSETASISNDCYKILNLNSELGRILLNPDSQARYRCGTGVTETGDRVDTLNADAQKLDTYVGEDGIPSLLLLVVRAQEPTGKINPWNPTAPRQFPIRIVGDMPVTFAGAPAVAKLYRQEDPNTRAAFSCLAVEGHGAAGLPTTAEICRRVRPEAPDADISSIAQRFVAKDIASLSP